MNQIDRTFSLSQFTKVQTEIPQRRSFAFATTDQSQGNGPGPELRAVGDINNDGIDDLYIHYYESSTAPVFLLGTISGRFTQLNYDQDGADRRHIRNGELVDLNNDGWLDVVGFTTGDNSNVYLQEVGVDVEYFFERGQEDLVLINQQGAGFLAADLSEITDGRWHHGGTTGDIDNDGLVDLIPIAETSGEVTVPIRNLDGFNFSLGHQSLNDELTDMLIPDADAGDLNNDGFLDIVINTSRVDENAGNDNPVVSPSLRIIYGDGNFDFSDNVVFDLGSHWLTYDAGWEWIESMDLSNFAAELFTSGLGQFTPGTSSVELLDVNNDGLLDILEGQHVSGMTVWLGSGFKYYQNTGKGFVDRTGAIFPNQELNRALGASDDLSTPFIDEFSLADLNGDGLQDLILQVNGGSPLISNTFESGREEGYPFIFIQGSDGTFLPPNIQNMAFETWPNSGLAPGDFNGDGRNDIVAFSMRPDGEVVLDTYLGSITTNDSQPKVSSVPILPSQASTQTSNMIRVAFGSEYLELYSSAGFSLYSRGYSHGEVAELIVSLHLIEELVGYDSKSWVNHIYRNLVGIDPTYDDLEHYSARIDQGGEATKVELLGLAVEVLET